MAMLNNQRVHVNAWNKGRMHKIFIPVWHVAKENRRYQISQEKTSHYTLHPQIYAIQVSAGRIHWLVEPFDSSVWIQNLQGQASFLACLKIGWLPKCWCLTTSFCSLHIEKNGVHCTPFRDEPNWSQVILPGFPNGIPRWFWSSST